MNERAEKYALQTYYDDVNGYAKRLTDLAFGLETYQNALDNITAISNNKDCDTFEAIELAKGDLLKEVILVTTGLQSIAAELTGE